MLLTARFFNDSQTQTFQRLVKSVKSQYEHEKLLFWPFHPEGELDLLLSFEDFVVGIEVKYNSGLSSDDDVDNTDRLESVVSQQQLSRESRIVADCMGVKQGFLLLLATDADAAYISRETNRRDIIDKRVAFGYLTWQDAYNVISQVAAAEFELPWTIMLRDMTNLLKRKGFERFKDFDLTGSSVSKDQFFRFNFLKQFSFEYPQKSVEGGYYEFI